jgi:hypothetical protein
MSRQGRCAVGDGIGGKLNCGRNQHSDWVHGCGGRFAIMLRLASMAFAKAKNVRMKTMTTVRLRAAFSGLVALGTLALLPTAASANCDWYVKTALEQQQRNVKMRCGYSGAEWSVDKGAHATWCAGVGPDVSRAMAQKREAGLAQCKSK